MDTLLTAGRKFQFWEINSLFVGLWNIEVLIQKLNYILENLV
jgi:hypothetical protein